ncbi:PAS domain-containing protein [Sorangium sp. So ce1000]|uniref:PAS domain-containing protein n=1 Tax=Sorangium sp. So ce1000 TaxID=3133325 RepID=UPI003F63A457
MSRDRSERTSGPYGRAEADRGSGGGHDSEAGSTAGGHCQLDGLPAPGGVSAHIDDHVDYKAECGALRARVEELEKELASRRGELGREGGLVSAAATYLDAPFAWSVTQLPALINWRPDGTVTRWNDAAARLFGWSEDEAVSRRLSDLVAADPVSPQEAQAFNHDLGESLFATTTSAGRTREGNAITCRWTYAVLRDERGDIREIAAIVDEGDDPRRREHLLQERYQMLLQLVDNSPNVMFIKDAQGRYVFLNRHFARAHRRHVIEFLGKDEHEFGGTPPSAANLIVAKEREVLASGRAMRYEEVLDFGGQNYYFFTAKFPFRNERGELVGVGGVVREDTDLRRAEAERAALQEQIIAAQQEALRELSTPLIPLADGVLAMPLVGTMDGARAGQIMETLLAGISSQRAHTAILDITGVRAVDALVADALTRTARAAQMLGARVVLTGIRPEVARALLELGADLSGIITLGTLQSGIAHALRPTERPRVAR